MRLAYFDCPTGISGDMILGAIVDSGVPLEQIKAGLAGLAIDGYEISTERVIKNGLAATQVKVKVQDLVTERTLSEILSIVKESQIPEKIKEKAIGVFNRIGAVEAQIHGVEVEKIHLHELGGQDTVIDVVGAFLGMDLLGIDEVYASPLPLGNGMVDTAHGKFPLPAPATLALLEGVPVRGSEFDKELVTPTGAALLISLVRRFGSIPAMRLEKTGYGAGQADLPIPNVLRLLIGESTEKVLTASTPLQEQLECLETNIDNMNPEIYSYLSERLFEAGALDVTFTPVQMKKNRPGTLVSVLCKEENVEVILKILFSETTTLGIRHFPVNRYFLERKIIQVSTEYGTVRVKLSKKGEASWDYSPEYEDCRRLALENSVPIKEIYRAAEEAAIRYIAT